jgi:hypothetical protein
VDSLPVRLRPRVKPYSLIKPLHAAATLLCKSSWQGVDRPIFLKRQAAPVRHLSRYIRTKSPSQQSTSSSNTNLVPSVHLSRLHSSSVPVITTSNHQLPYLTTLQQRPDNHEIHSHRHRHRFPRHWRYCPKLHPRAFILRQYTFPDRYTYNLPTRPYLCT